MKLNMRDKLCWNGRVAMALLGGCVFLGWRYWFSTPLRGVLLATVLYLAGIASSLSHGA